MDALIKKNPLICVMSVDIGNGKTGTININYNDEILGNNINFHTIRTDKIEHIKCDYKNILPNSVLKKYKKLSEEIYKIK